MDDNNAARSSFSFTLSLFKHYTIYYMIIKKK